METLAEKAQRLGMKPAGKPVATSTAPQGETLAQKAQRLGMKPATPPQTDGFFKSLAKDVAETLVVKPVARATELVGRTGVLGQNVKKGYQEMSQTGQAQRIFGMDVEAQKAFGQGGAKQTVGDALKVGSYLYGGGGVGAVGKATLAGKIGTGLVQGAKVGAISGGAYGAGEELQNTDATVGSTLKAGALGTAIGGVSGGVLGGAFPAVTAGIKSLKPEKIMNRVARVNPSDAIKFKKLAKTDIGDYLIKRGIYGNDEEIVTQLSDRFIRSKDVADEAIAKLGGTWKHKPVTTALDDLLARETRISSEGAPSRDLARITELVNKNKLDGLEMKEINEVKRLYERNIKLDYLKQNLPESVARANTIDDAIRTWQFSQAEKLGLKNLPEINKETQLARQLGDALLKKGQSQQGNNAFGLTDAILISGGDPQAIAMLLTKKTFGSKGVQSAIAKKLAPKASVGQPEAIMRNAIDDLGRLLPSAKGPEINPATGRVISVPTGETIPMGAPKPSKSGIDRAGTEAMNKYYVEQAQRNTLRLPAGNPSDVAIPMGAPVGRSSIEVLPAKKGPVGADPKTGRFMKTYTSEGTTADQAKQVSQQSRLKLESKSSSPIVPPLGKAGKMDGVNKQAGFIKAFNDTNITTKILKDLEGKTTVSKQYILDATNRGELKQVERDLIRDVVGREGDTVNVADFTKKVKAELLPLKRKTVAPEKGTERYSGLIRSDQPRYESVSLPDELRGKVKNYSENIYESPIKTSAGDTHFRGTSDNYFGHTRIEDMADNKTRRVIEVQSDLYQKGRLETEGSEFSVLRSGDDSLGKLHNDVGSQGVADLMAKRKTELSKLQQYNDPTAHFRMVREEIKKASLDGKTKLQFPTGETAMKIEGLGETTQWTIKRFPDDYKAGGSYDIEKLTPEKLKVGERVWQGEQGQGRSWIITDVLGDGKFKAVPKSNLLSKEIEALQKGTKLPERSADLRSINDASETFDISGKVDTNNPIYKFYEKDIQKYLNKFGGKRVVDEQGVSWIEIPITKKQGQEPVEAFGKIANSPLMIGAGTTGAFALGMQALENKKKK